MAFPLLRGASSGVTARPPSPAGPSCFPAAALHFRVLLKECDAVVFVGRHSPASFLGKSYHKVLRHCNRGKNTVCLSETEILYILKEMGFTNIRSVGLGDLKKGWLYKEGNVKTVSIGDITKFSVGDVFEKDAEVVISYHSFPEN